MKAELIKTVDSYELFTQGFLKGSTNHKLIDSLNIEEGPIRYKLSLKNCEAIERGYDLDEVVEDIVKTIVPNDRGEDIWYGTSMAVGKLCFQKALELMGDKKFSEDDMRIAFFHVQNSPFFNEFIKSLQQTEWDVEIVMKNVIDETKIVGAIKGVKGSGNKITTYKQIPKLNADRCLILKRT